MALKRIKPSNKPMWRQFWQNARGRADLKQVCGLLVVLALIYIAVVLAHRTGTVPDSLIYTLGAIAILWWIGDTTEAVSVLKALYGGFQPTPQVQNNNTIGGEATLNQPGTTTNGDPNCNPPVSE